MDIDFCQGNGEKHIKGSSVVNDPLFKCNNCETAKRMTYMYISKDMHF